MHQDPHQLIEGIMITCFANNVKQAYIYIRGEFPEGARILERAIAEARAANFVGPNILGIGLRLRNLRPPRRGRLHLRRGNRADRVAGGQAALSRGSSRRIFRPSSGSTSARRSSTTSRRSAT